MDRNSFFEKKNNMYFKCILYMLENTFIRNLKNNIIRVFGILHVGVYTVTVSSHSVLYRLFIYHAFFTAAVRGNRVARTDKKNK